MLSKWTRLVALSAAASLGLAYSSPASADTIFCAAKIYNVAVDPNGQLTIQVGSYWPVMCNVNGTISYSGGTVSAATCKSWVSMFPTAQATQKNAVMAFHYPATANCETLTNVSWVVPNPYPYWVTVEG